MNMFVSKNYDHDFCLLFGPELDYNETEEFKEAAI
jgi:hypothetical protein